MVVSKTLHQLSLRANILRMTPTYTNILMDYILFQHVKYGLATSRTDAKETKKKH